MRSHAVVLLQAFAVVLFVIPSNSVIGALGGAGYAAALVGVSLLLLFGVALLLGVHDPRKTHNPIRGVVCLVALSILASYALMDRALLTSTEMAGADRMLIRLAVIAGVALVGAEWLGSLSDVRRVVRVICWGAAFCGAVAALQYWISLDLAKYVRELPGFTLNADNPAILARGDLNRAAGTAITPIELGVVAGMLMPLAVYHGIYGRNRTFFMRWAPLGLIGLGALTSVSRSAVIAIVVSFSVLIVLMPPVQRLVALAAAPLAVVGAFMSAHGLIGTLGDLFAAGSSDASVQYRLEDYPVAERLIHDAPLFGHGGGTYIPANPLFIFDNQYLLTAVELGAIGVAVLLLAFLIPTVCALVARAGTRSPELQLLCAALAGAVAAGAMCSLTFDSFAFPMFAGVYALVIGLIGAVWRLARSEVALTTSRSGPVLGSQIPAPAKG